MSRGKLLSTIVESEHIIRNLSKNGLEIIARIQNLSQNELKQIIKMSNLSQNRLEQIVKMTRIKKLQEYVEGRFINCSFKTRAKHC